MSSAVVIFESMFGNTAAIAAVVADELVCSGLEVKVFEISTAPPAHEIHADLVVLGAPTHTFSLSRPGTREDAVRQGAPTSHSTSGMREWLAEARQHRPVLSLPVAAFDTRVSRVRRLPGSAARKISRLAPGATLEPLVDVASFYVDDVAGPLVDGELDRARDWAHALTRKLAVGSARRRP